MLGLEENLDSFTITLEEDEEGNLVLPFPEELLDALGWGEGDILEFDAIAGQISMRKVEDGMRPADEIQVSD
jgi:hypothetical protein